MDGDAAGSPTPVHPEELLRRHSKLIQHERGGVGNISPQATSSCPTPRSPWQIGRSTAHCHGGLLDGPGSTGLVDPAHAFVSSALCERSGERKFTPPCRELRELPASAALLDRHCARASTRCTRAIADAEPTAEWARRICWPGGVFQYSARLSGASPVRACCRCGGGWRGVPAAGSAAGRRGGAD